MPRHAPPRREIAFSDSAARQIDRLARGSLHALDRALVAISIEPALGRRPPDSVLLEYTDAFEDVRVNYFVTMVSIVVVVYVEA
jgi:hypothetical protein